MMKASFLALLFCLAQAQLDPSTDDAAPEVVREGKGNLDEGIKQDLPSPYEFKSIEVASDPLDVRELCQMIYGEKASPSKKNPTENADTILVINCQKKGSSKLLQIPLFGSTLAYLDELILSEKCKDSSQGHDYELARIVKDQRNPKDLYERYFTQSTPVSVTCRRSLDTPSTTRSQPQSKLDLFVKAIEKQKIEMQKRRKLQEAIKRAKTKEA